MRFVTPNPAELPDGFGITETGFLFVVVKVFCGVGFGVALEVAFLVGAGVACVVATAPSLTVTLIF